MTEPSPPAAPDGRLTNATRRATRGYAHCLLAGTGGTVLFAALIGTAPGRIGVAIGLAYWLLALIGLTLYQRRQRALIKRFATLHLIVIMTWASLWIITVMAGSYFSPGDLSWWLPAGIVTALPAMIGAIVVYRATR